MKWVVSPANTSSHQPITGRSMEHKNYVEYEVECLLRTKDVEFITNSFDIVFSDENKLALLYMLMSWLMDETDHTKFQLNTTNFDLLNLNFEFLHMTKVIYNLSNRKESSVAGSATMVGSVSIWSPSRSSGSKPALSTSSEGNKSVSKPVIAFPNSLAKSCLMSASSAPVKTA